jgi:hypothetical protein
MIKSIEESNDLIGNQTLDLSAYSIEENEMCPTMCSDRGVVYVTGYITLLGQYGGQLKSRN